jgi:hypothetical protein
VPAAAVIPAPIAYIKVVAVKKLVVGFQAPASGPFNEGHCSLRSYPPARRGCSSSGARGGRNVYFEKIRVFKAGASPG